jgi:hypothetical protein
MSALPDEPTLPTRHAADLAHDVILHHELRPITNLLRATNGAMPNNLTNCVLTAPVVGANGALRWTFGGTAIFRVSVAQ